MHPIDFFAELYATVPAGLGQIELRRIPHGNGFPDRAFCADEARLNAVVNNWGREDLHSGLYYGVSLRRQGATTGKKEDVVAVPALWADIDTDKLGWDQTLTLGALKAHALRPSLVVNSGYGFHAYWLLKEPVILPEYDPRKIHQVEQTIAAVSEVFGQYDRTHDITRVLRVPGSWNTKDIKKPRPVKLVVADWRLEYDLEDLALAAADSNTALVNGEWLSKAEVKKRNQDARAAQGRQGLVGAMMREAGYNGKQLPIGQLWQHTKYKPKAGEAFIGVDEAILRATAYLWAAHGGEWQDDMIVDTVLGEVRRVKTRDAPNERWDWAAERREIADKLERWKSKWQALKDGAQTTKGRKRQSGKTA